MNFKRPSQTTISAIVGTVAGIALALLPYLQNSPSPTLRMIAVLMMSLGFGNGLRAAPDSTEVVKTDKLIDKPKDKPVTVGDLTEASEKK